MHQPCLDTEFAERREIGLDKHFNALLLRCVV